MFDPIVTCQTCGTSMHDYAAQRAAHGRKCEAQGFTRPTVAEAKAAGWEVTADGWR